MFRNELVPYLPSIDKLCLGDSFMCLVLEALIPVLSILKSSFLKVKKAAIFIYFISSGAYAVRL